MPMTKFLLAVLRRDLSVELFPEEFPSDHITMYEYEKRWTVLVRARPCSDRPHKSRYSRRLVRTLTGMGVRVEFVKESLVFTGEDSPMATLLLSVMGAFADFERALILERQREGIAAAKQRGVYTGRKPALTDEQARQLRDRARAGERKSALAKEFGISRETVYAYLRAETAPAEASSQRL
jgi:DNA invertase Pin-like site-specific DNA recombinase